MTTSTGSIGTRPITPLATAPIAPPQYERPEYTTGDLFRTFLKEKVKDVAKVFGYAAFWAGQVKSLPPPAKEFSKTMGDFKNFVSATELPQKTKETWDALKGLWTSVKAKAGIGKAAREVFKKSTALTNSAVDGLEFSSRFVPIDSATMGVIKGINFGVLIGGAGNGAIEDLQKLVPVLGKEHEVEKKKLYMINLARDISYTLVGAVGFFCFITTTAVVPWVMVGFLSVGLACTIGSYIYEKIYDPEGTGKNLNPEIVIKNDRLRREYEQRLAQRAIVQVA